jgi:protein-S-isoprenylcysteine O-methyltransferase Ste14
LAAQWQSIARDPSALALAVIMAVAIGMPIVEFTMRESVAVSFSVSMITGLMMIIFGALCGYLANREIAENWSPIIEKTAKQRLITSGIYGVVRHPLYSSGLLILAGTNTYFGSRWAWLGTIIVLAGILCRIPLEEKKLIDRFGQEYITYRQQTKAILPWIF